VSYKCQKNTSEYVAEQEALRLRVMGQRGCAVDGHFIGWHYRWGMPFFPTVVW